MRELRSEYAANVALQHTQAWAVGRYAYRPAPARARKPFFHPKDRIVVLGSTAALVALAAILRHFA